MIFNEKIGVQSVRLALSLLAGSALLAGGVHAQEAVTADKIQKIEITGSNIKRTNKEGTSPIQTISAKEIRDSGAKTVSDLMKQVPSMGTDGFSDLATQNGFSRGVATASLRNLGSTSTLVLLNGRRMTPSAYANPNNGASTLYDLNTIPLSSLERIEIFKDGASAVYGSDAIGGVINFITKSDYQGIELSARAGANDDGEFGKQGISAVAGFGNFNNDGYNVFVAADYTKKNATSERNGSNDIQAAQYADMNFRLNPYNSSVSNQPFFYRERTPGSKSFVTGATVVNRKACDPSRLIVGGPEHNIAKTSTLFGRQFCNYDLDQFNDVQGKGEDVSVMARGTFKINEKISAFTEAAYTKSDRTFRVASRSINAQAGPTTNFLLGGLAEPFQAILPVGHPDNPFPTSRAAAVYRFENIAGGTALTNNNARLLAGLKGEYNNWDWETAVLWNQTKREETSYGNLYLPTLRKLIAENRSLASIAADPTLARNLTNIASADIVQYDAKASTEFGKLGGGAIGFATGLELRQERIKITPDPLNARGEILGLATTQTDGKRNVASGFFEVRAPFLTNFEMDFAGRFDKYPDIKTNFVPKVGAKWTVTDSLAIRSTYAEGFRAPAVSQVTPGGAQFFLNNTVDPVRCPNGTTPAPGADQIDCAKSISGVGGSNPNLKPETSKSYSLGLIYSPSSKFDVLIDYFNIRKEGEVALLSGTSVLEHPERYSADAILRDTNPANQLAGIPNSGPLLGVRTPWVNQGSTEVSGIDLEIKLRNSLGAMGDLSSSLRATYNLSYKRAEEPGQAEANVVGANGGLSNWATSSGDIPRVKATLSTSWTKEAHNVTAGINYVSPISQLRRSDNDVTYPAPYCHYGSGQPATAYSLGGVPKYTSYYPDCAVSSWTTVDVGYSYSGIKNLTIGLKIANVFDSKAPYQPGKNTDTVIINGYNAGLHNNYGRYFTLSANYRFK
ncbi:TonB-dependent receptor [soil metagenome]